MLVPEPRAFVVPAAPKLPAVLPASVAPGARAVAPQVVRVAAARQPVHVAGSAAAVAAAGSSRFVTELVASRVHVLLVVRPDDDSYLRRLGHAGHPASLEALAAAGASVRLLRASCLCLGRRLATSGTTAELFGETTVHVEPTAPERALPAVELARGLTHLRCWEEASRRSGGEWVVVLEANCRAASGAWAPLVQAVCAAAGRPEDVLLLCEGSSLAAYALSPRACSVLAGHWRSLLRLGVDSTEALLQRLQQSLQLRVASLPMVLEALLPCNRDGAPIPCPVALPKPPALRPRAVREGSIKVFVITLPHREDRRRPPLVCSTEALEAMRAAGCDVEVLRASCYCERDSLVAAGELGCYLQDSASASGLPHWARMHRYAGVNLPVRKKEAEALRSFIDEHYQAGGGAERLVNSMGGEGGIKGYVVDTNWPGATSCAISHARALMSAALDGYSSALVFEDDAVIPRTVAWRRGWCEGSCRGPLCFCPRAWRACLEDALALLRKADDLDVLYLGLGEAFEEPGPAEGLLPGGGVADLPRRWWLGALSHVQCGLPPPQRADPGGLTQIGYTWQAQAMMYTRRALDDLLAFPLSEILWGHDETIPHLYGRKPWNPRYVDALKSAGWRRPWVAAAPSGAIDLGWVYQLETLTSDYASDLNLGTAWQSSNAEEF